jgi:hypothetical protein
VSNHSDCDDGNGNVHPGAAEVCNHVDDNCDGNVDEGVSVLVYADTDHDGYGDLTATGYSGCAGDYGTSTSNDDCDDDGSDPNAQYAHPYPGVPDGQIPWFTTSINATTGPRIGVIRVPCWDYDCNGTSEKQPSVNACFATGNTCSAFITPRCGSTGPQPYGSANCSDSVTFQVCGACSGTCAASFTYSQALGCH